MDEILNIASTLTETARRLPEQRAVVVPVGRDSAGRVAYADITFRQLDQLSDRLADGFRVMEIEPGARIVLMVRPGIEFIALTYALFKAGAIVVLIDPGMGPRRVFRCLDQVDPHGFVAVPIVHALRTLSVGRFPNARWNVTVGRRWFWSGTTYAQLQSTNRQTDVLRSPTPPPLRKGGAGGVALQNLSPSTAPTRPSDPAAIIFTSGSTGPAKGVVYEHGMFAAQVAALRDYYGIAPGGVDLPGFPLFALFNAAMGMTTVIPDMDPSRPAQVKPERIVQAIEDQRITQGFGSPAIWKRVARFCNQRGITFPTIERVFSAGAPVPLDVLAQMRKTLTGPHAEMFTPYGATEALPVCSISATEVLERTAEKTRRGAGTCVGLPFPQVELKIIEIVDGPLRSLAEARELPPGGIGEIIVRGAMVTREYFRQPEATAGAKITEGESFWHRMGDVGYLDPDGALWYCGRKSHIVETDCGRMFTDCVEPIFNAHPAVSRCALVGVGAKPSQTPVMVLELELPATLNSLLPELQRIAAAHESTRNIERFLVYPRSLPVDVRHNIKINREQLAAWAQRTM